jgi:hypothetical protein
MEQAIIGILSGDLDSASLLMLFIVGILTKRFVPWWIHEEVVEKLQEYEDAAPALLEEVSILVEQIKEDSYYSDSIRARRTKIKERQEDLRNALPRTRRKRSR